MKIIIQLLTATLLSTFIASQAMAAKFIASQSAPAATTETKPAPPVATSVIPATPARISVAAATPAPAQAAPATQPRTPPHAGASDSGMYLGAQLGDSTIGAMLGYKISKMYAMEFSYDYVDPVYTPTTSLKIYRIGVSGQALFPIKFSEMGPMSIFVKVGYARTTEKYTVKDPGLGIPAFPATTTVTTTLKTGVTAGAGVQVDLSSNTSARLGGNYVGGDRSVYLAALYRF